MFFSPADCSFVPTVSLLKNDTSQPVAGCNLPHTNHVFLPNMLCPTQPVAGCISPHKHVFLPNMFFPIHTFLWSNCVFAGKRQFATSCGVYLSTETCFLTKHVFPIHSFVWSNCVFAGKRQFATSCGVYLSTIMYSHQTCFFQTIRSFVPTVSLLENDNSQPVAGCIFPQKHVFLPNMFFPTHSFFWSNCVFSGKRQFATSCGVYLSTETCFLTKHVFPIHSFFWSNCVFAGKRQFATSCGVYLSTNMFSYQTCFSNPFVPLFQLCLCWKTTIRNQLRGVSFHRNMFSYQTCFFQSIHSFGPTVSLLENDNSQPVAGCIFPQKHVFLPNMFFQSIHSFVPTVSLLENDNSQPVAGCIFSPQSCILTKHVFSKPFVLLFQVCLCRKAIIRNQLRRAFYTIMFPHKCVSLFGSLKSRCRFA